MKKWCSNRVIFYAGRSTQVILAELFTALSKGEQNAVKGLMPPFVLTNGFRYRNIRWDYGESVVYYETNGSPNLRELIELADFYGCAFECTYSIPDSMMYARAMYNHGILTHDRPKRINNIK
jgi:hypothetical protein